MHWLVEEKSGEHVWQQSKRALKILRQYVDVKKSHLYESRELENIWGRAEHQRIMIISDKAGTGKTTVLTHLSKRIKRNSSANWLVSIDLNDYTELVKAQKGMKMDKGKVFEFISKEVLKLEYNLEKELFKKNFEENEISKVVVMV
jgi:ABC-type phosphate/phosphonate transport system ATPase subunit